MNRRLLHVSKLRTFTNDDTGEVISGGYVSLCIPESVSDDAGIGCFTENIWVSKDIIEKLFKQVTVDKLPCLVDVITEQRTIKGKSRIIDIKIL